MPYAECSDCSRAAGPGGNECESIHRVELKARIAPLCCECVQNHARKNGYRGNQVFDSWNWGISACASCRKRKYAKCGGKFQKRALSSLCLCGLTKEEHMQMAAFPPPEHSQTQGRENSPPPMGRVGSSSNLKTEKDALEFTARSFRGGATASPPAHAMISPRPVKLDPPQQHQREVESYHFVDSNKPGLGTQGIPGLQQHNTEQRTSKLQTTTPPTPNPNSAMPPTIEASAQSSPAMRAPVINKDVAADFIDIPDAPPSPLKQANAIASSAFDRAAVSTASKDPQERIRVLENMLEQEKSEKLQLEERFEKLEQQMDQTIQHVVSVVNNEKSTLKQRVDQLEAARAQDKDEKGKLHASLKVLEQNYAARELERKALREERDKLRSISRSTENSLLQVDEEIEIEFVSSQKAVETTIAQQGKVSEKMVGVADRASRIMEIDRRVNGALNKIEGIKVEQQQLRQRAMEASQLSAQEADEIAAVKRDYYSIKHREMEINAREQDLRNLEFENAAMRKEINQLHADKEEQNLILTQHEQRIASLQGKDSALEGHTDTKLILQQNKILMEQLQEANAYKEKLKILEQKLIKQAANAFERIKSEDQDSSNYSSQNYSTSTSSTSPSKMSWSFQKGGIKVLKTKMMEPSENKGITDTETRISSSTQDSQRTTQIHQVEINSSELDDMQKIAEGSFAVVYKAKWQSARVAIKSLRIPSSLSVEEIDSMVSDFSREVHRLMHLRHPNVLSFFGTVRTGTSVGIVTELLDSDLRKYLKTQARKDPILSRLKLAREAATGIRYLHSQQLVHRDIKPENFLLQHLTADQFVVKVCDFGLSRIKETSQVNTQRTAGTLTYIAPEIHRGEAFDEGSDVYSFSIMLWEIVSLKTPHEDKSPASIPGIVGWGMARPPLEAVEEMFPDRSSMAMEYVLSVLRQGWHNEPAKRLTMTEAVHRVEMAVGDLLGVSDSFKRKTSSGSSANQLRSPAVPQDQWMGVDGTFNF